MVFYDKLKDLRKAKISEKRAEEKDNALQMDLFKDVDIKKPFEVLRMEIRLNRKQKLIQILKKVGFNEEPTFQSLFKKELAQKVLFYYLNEIEAGYPTLLNYTSDPKDFISEFLINNPNAGFKKAIQMLGLRVLLDGIGIREFREVTRQYGNENWYRLHKELKDLSYPAKDSPLKFLRQSITEFKPLKMAEFTSATINKEEVN